MSKEEKQKKLRKPKTIPKPELIIMLHDELNEVTKDHAELMEDIAKCRPIISKNTLEDLELSLKDLEDQLKQINESIVKVPTLPDEIDMKVIKQMLDTE